MKKLLALALVFCFSSSSNAYDHQQYFVGDTGPNGGTITNVTIESVLSDTETSLQGDYLETIDTYTYTEMFMRLVMILLLRQNLLRL